MLYSENHINFSKSKVPANGLCMSDLCWVFLCRYIHVTHILAVANAIRTSLGPRGMDKMVNIMFDKLFADATFIFT